MPCFVGGLAAEVVALVAAVVFVAWRVSLLAAALAAGVVWCLLVLQRLVLVAGALLVNPAASAYAAWAQLSVLAASLQVA